MRTGQRAAATRLPPVLAGAVADLRQRLRLVMLLSAAMALLVLTIPLYLTQVYSRVLTSGSVETLVLITVIAVAALLFLAIFDAVRSAVLARLASRFDVALAGHILAAAIQQAGISGRSDVQGLRDLATVKGFIASPQTATLFDAPFLPLFLLLLFLLHPLLGLVTLAGALLLAGLAWQTARATRSPVEEAGREAIAAMRQAQAFTDQADTVQSLGLLDAALRQWGKPYAAAIAAGQRAGAVANRLGAASKFVRLLLQIALLGVGAGLVLAGQLSAGAIFAASIIGSRALAPVEAIVALLRNWAQVREAYQRVETLLAGAPEYQPRMALPAPRGRVGAEALVYQPAGAQRAILRGISFEIEPGECIGIVGPSGAGKSTLARLIVGALRPTQGRLRIDGADSLDWSREQLGRYLGYMPQSPEFFPASLADNIARLPEIRDDAAVVAAATAAGAHEMILAIPDGYNRAIGRSALELSGGQKQRIALARALYGAPAIIVLDEPNAHLDVDGEAALKAAIRGAKEDGRTVIIVAQRPSAIELADRIMVLRDGRVDAFGPRDTILQQIMPRGANVVAVNAPGRSA